MGKDKYTFETDEFRYIINFKEMTQENTDRQYQTKRNIKRRPDDKPSQTYVLSIYISPISDHFLHL